MKCILLVICLSILDIVFGQQPFEVIIETDSSTIEIVRNSEYKIYTEKFKKSDSVWYSVHFIRDTARLNTEGWKLKNGKYLGIWKEYNWEGDLLFTMDYDRHTCVVNPAFYPYHELLQEAKRKADQMIIDAYGSRFFEKHVVFDFNCYAYKRYREKFVSSNDSIWTEDYLGSWTEPLTSKPNSFLLRYTVKLDPADDEGVELGICLDDRGNYVPSSDDKTNNYGFEKRKSIDSGFVLKAGEAIRKAMESGLATTDTSKLSGFLYWENFKRESFYNGRFRYYLLELREETKYQASERRKGILRRYNVYVFDPWTGYLENKRKMKSFTEWEVWSGSSSGLLPDNDQP